MVHRDIKPANILLEEDDNPLIADFGLAARQDDESRLTNDGAVMGTPSYMAPEQAAGQKGEANPAADQYSLGVMLYELLTGRPPFEGPPAIVIHNQIHTNPKPPGKLRRDLPRDLETICLKAMAKRPEDRYPDCQALADDLRRWTEGEPITARRLGFVERGIRWVKKEPKLAGALGAVLASLVVIGVLLVVKNTELIDRLQIVEKERDDNRDRADSEKQSADAAKWDADQARDRRDDEKLNAAASKAGMNDLAGTEKLLGEIPIGRRGPDWGFVAMLARHAPDFGRVLHRPGPAVGGTAWLTFPGGNDRLLGLGDDRSLTLWNVWTGAAKSIGKLAGKLPPPPPQNIPGASTDPDRSVIVSADGKRVVVVLTEGGPKDKDGKEPPLTIKLTVFDVETGSELRSWVIDGFWPSVITNADGSRVAVAYATVGQPHHLWVWDVATGERINALDKELAPAPLQGVVLAFSPDGCVLAATTARDKGEIGAWAVPGGEEVMTVPDIGLVSQLAFSPDGKRIAAIGGAEVIRHENELAARLIQVCEPRSATRTATEYVTTKQKVKKIVKDKEGKDCEVEYEVEVVQPVTKNVQYTYMTCRQLASRGSGPWLEPRIEMTTHMMYKTVPVKKMVTQTVAKKLEAKGKRTVNGKEEECNCQITVETPVFKEVMYEEKVPYQVQKSVRRGENLLRVWDRPDNCAHLPRRGANADRGDRLARRRAAAGLRNRRKRRPAAHLLGRIRLLRESIPAVPRHQPNRNAGEDLAQPHREARQRPRPRGVPRRRLPRLEPPTACTWRPASTMFPMSSVGLRTRGN